MTTALTQPRESYALKRKQLTSQRAVEAIVLKRRVSFKGLPTTVTSPLMPVTAKLAKTIHYIHRCIAPFWVYRCWSMKLLRMSVNLVCIIIDNYSKMDFEKADEMINALYGEAKNIRNDIKDWEKGDCPKTILCRCLKKTLERSEAVLLKLSSDIPLLVVPESTEMIRILKDRITLAKGNGQSAEVTRACHELYAIRTNSKLETNALTSDLGNEVEEIKPCDFNDILGWSGGEGIWLEREVVTIKTPIPLVHVFRRSRSKSAAGLELLQRFNRQLEQWRALDHPHVLGLYGWYGHGHTAYLVSPRVEMARLHIFVAENLNNISSFDRLRLMREIVLGLIYMHDCGVIHGALSPHTIFVNPSHSAILADFSFTNVLHPSHLDTSTEQGISIPVLRYQPPEMFQGQEKLHPSGDSYSWAMSSLLILSGTHPYPQENVQYLLLQRVCAQKRPPAVEEHPTAMWDTCPGLWGLLQPCLAMGEGERPKLTDTLHKIIGVQEQLAAGSNHV